jgi:tetratricopeptide (TPR) repeat protein
MMKQTTNSTGFKAKLSGLLFGLGLFVVPALLSAADAPPPPPFINPDAAVDNSVAWGTTPSPTETPDSQASFNPQSTENSDVAAPQISDDQQIKNSMEMAYQLYHAEDYDAAGKATAQIVERYPKKKLFWVRYLNALSLEQQGLYARAIEQYQKVKELTPRSTYSNSASFRIGLCQLKSGQEQESIYTLRDIIENNPRSEYRLQAYVHLGNLYRRTRDWRAAQRIYKDLIRLYPGTSWAYTSTLYLAETHAHQGHNDIAIKVYDGLVRNDTVPVTIRAQAQLRIGDLYMLDQRWLEALETYRLALRDFSKVPGISMVAEEKIGIATEGRRSGRLPYRPIAGPRARGEAPADAAYRLKQQSESVPYQD